MCSEHGISFTNQNNRILITRHEMTILLIRHGVYFGVYEVVLIEILNFHLRAHSTHPIESRQFRNYQKFITSNITRLAVINSLVLSLSFHRFPVTSRRWLASHPIGSPWTAGHSAPAVSKAKSWNTVRRLLATVALDSLLAGML